MAKIKHLKQNLGVWMKFDRARHDCCRACRAGAQASIATKLCYYTAREQTKLRAKKFAERAGSKGFSLTEMVIYVAILSVLTIVTVNSTFSAIRSFAEFRVSRDLNSSGASLMERLTREIRMANGIDAPNSALGTNPGRLKLLTKDTGGANTTVEFYIENNLLKIKEGGVAAGSLTSSTTAVTNFIARSLTNANSSAIKAEIGLTATRGNISKSGNFYTTIILRGGY